ncbi:hypothetical protein [Nevskia ramosa]|uniref:hypothetical protein n=1 Tax=Nevskia ramosa TaxID=64002 RepID=UPI003D13D6DB
MALATGGCGLFDTQPDLVSKTRLGNGDRIVTTDASRRALPYKKNLSPGIFCVEPSEVLSNYAGTVGASVGLGLEATGGIPNPAAGPLNLAASLLTPGGLKQALTQPGKDGKPIVDPSRLTPEFLAKVTGALRLQVGYNRSTSMTEQQLIYSDTIRLLKYAQFTACLSQLNSDQPFDKASFDLTQGVLNDMARSLIATTLDAQRTMAEAQMKLADAELIRAETEAAKVGQGKPSKGVNKPFALSGSPDIEARGPLAAEMASLDRAKIDAARGRLESDSAISALIADPLGTDRVGRAREQMRKGFAALVNKQPTAALEAFKTANAIYPKFQTAYEWQTAIQESRARSGEVLQQVCFAIGKNLELKLTYGALPSEVIGLTKFYNTQCPKTP